MIENYNNIIDLLKNYQSDIYYEIIFIDYYFSGIGNDQFSQDIKNVRQLFIDNEIYFKNPYTKIIVIGQ